jgi:hypothetical protein
MSICSIIHVCLNGIITYSSYKYNKFEKRSVKESDIYKIVGFRWIKSKISLKQVFFNYDTWLYINMNLFDNFIEDLRYNYK